MPTSEKTHTPKPPVEFDRAATVAMAEAIFIKTMLSAAGNSYSPDHHAKKALAIAVAFREAVEQDDFTKTAKQRFAELT